ncbi:hypothetical protein KFE25_002811 [Diacronema lutheri]|uniref:Uncharacterized protein n=1 Tax=Diacronema lutheri TaxID=2081491 RepID=A0A8J6CAG5_DIALT|nr:hypothetical protein KFE25_002811 [Diacronema lutheri]
MRVVPAIAAVGATAAVLFAAIEWLRRRARDAPPPTPADLFGKLNNLLIRCQRLRAAGVSDVERVREQIVALAVKERALQLEQPDSVQASRAHGKVCAAIIAIAAAITKLEEACGLQADAAPVSEELAAEDTYRERLLADEDAALDAYIARARKGAGGLARRLDVLARLIDRLRATEESLDFHAALLHCHAKLSAVAGYSQANFSYGSTPYHSWRALYDACPELSDATRGCTASGECIVFGSSLGWLCFYSTLTFGVPSRGYEVVTPLTILAGKVAASFELGEGCAFFNADMLTADLSQARVVTLTSKCWDKQLTASVYDKLQRELKPRSLVVDYSDALAVAHEFDVLARTTVAVSWSPAQMMAVMRKR